MQFSRLNVFDVHVLFFVSSLLFGAAQAIPNPFKLSVSVDVSDTRPASLEREVCLMVCLPEKPECRDKSVSSPADPMSKLLLINNVQYPKQFGVSDDPVVS
jgi:hypothetical protein